MPKSSAMPPHPRQHALAMASATHLKNMGHITPEHCDQIHGKCEKELKKGKNATASMSAGKGREMRSDTAFGSFAPKSVKAPMPGHATHYMSTTNPGHEDQF